MRDANLQTRTCPQRTYRTLCHAPRVTDDHRPRSMEWKVPDDRVCTSKTANTPPLSRYLGLSAVDLVASEARGVPRALRLLLPPPKKNWQPPVPCRTRPLFLSILPRADARALPPVLRCVCRAARHRRRGMCATHRYMRGDTCTATSSDAGSHYVCVNMTAGTTTQGKPCVADPSPAHTRTRTPPFFFLAGAS